ncbi:class I SAM-dependent DNA methyltransferase [Humibacillus xanthopallidus]|uniref:site-specific DNA-methyltransferase (adenine-specific) n=1 Tax=Humibacillus xanthopallidus TaxID=412689 RepID=A0A543HZN9_9MICO|nr:class I SAM-dependent DNA methyltransferase [Humibacillus xanthopallidus]TQM63817.1 type I restriction enzyme M protein [Humibacillus xanthopallidus]
MPPRKKVDPARSAAPSTMKELKDTLWKAADKLRGSMDASQYKDVILGLVFLKYVSDAFEERRGQIRDELAADGWDEAQIAPLLDDMDEYTAHAVFWVPPTARWGYLAQHAKGLPAQDGQPHKNIGQLVDEAVDLLIGANPSLKGAMPRIYNRDNVDQRRLGELIDLFNSARFTGQGVSKARDLLGEVYEYFLEKFARAEGKRGGEFFTPPSVVRTLVEVLEPTEGRVYDPACGSGGMFVQAEKFLAAHHQDKTAISIYGEELNERTWRLARMNLAIHGLNGNLGAVWGDTFAIDLHADVQMDYVMSNPPFNIKAWARKEDDPRWRFGVPPATNANFAWIQHIISKLAPGGSAGVVMANGSMSSNSGGEGEIRAQLVEADLVACMVALPTQLFRSTGIPVCVWFFAKDKTAGANGTVDRSGEVLFIDARELGYMVDRAERALADDDIAKIAGTYHAWRGTTSAVAGELTYADVPGFCKTVSLADIKAADYALTPGRYVGAAEAEDDGEPIDEKIQRLTKELFAQFDESARLEAAVREQLGRIHV